MTGVMKEFLKPAGSWPVVSERLNRYVKKGTNRSATNFSTVTGTDDLSGKALVKSLNEDYVFLKR